VDVAGWGPWSIARDACYILSTLTAS